MFSYFGEKQGVVMFPSRYQRLHGWLHSGGTTCFDPFVRLGDNGMLAVRLLHCTRPVAVQ